MPLALLSVLALVLPTVGCNGGPVPEGAERDAGMLEETTTVRLLERFTRTEVRWPADLEPVPDALRPAAVGQLPAPGRVVRVPLAHRPWRRDERAALLAPTGSRYRFSLRLPPAAVLRVGLGVYRSGDEEEGAVRFRIALAAAGEMPTVLLERDVALGDGWQDVELSLAAPRGAASEQEVRLDLETVAAAPGATHWAAWSAPEILLEETASPPAAPDVILISLDTLRADRLGCYGYARPTSPHLDAFAAAGVRFATAVAQSPWTRPSHRSLFTGLYPLSRGDLESPPLAEQLWHAGYRTLALTGGGQLDGRFGFARGFDAFRIDDWIRDPQSVATWLEANAGRKRFLFLHTYEIHEPYTHSTFAAPLAAGRLAPGFAKSDWARFREGGLSDEEQRYVEALYDGGIAYTDERLGQLFAALEASGALDRAIVVVTSDHGEQFWEHRSWGHGQTVYDHQLLVPLILRLPAALRGEGGPAVIEDQVSLVDLYPTIHDLLGLPLEHDVHGRSLRPLMEGGAESAFRYAFAENSNHPRFERKALRGADYKLLYSTPRRGRTGGGERFELYDLRRDPGEQQDLAAQRAEIAATLEARLRAILDSPSAAEPDVALPAGIDRDLRRRLEALGYVQAEVP